MKILLFVYFLLFITIIDLHFASIFAQIECYDDKCDPSLQLLSGTRNDIGIAIVNTTLCNLGTYVFTLLVQEVALNDCENAVFNDTHSIETYTRTNTSIFSACNEFTEIEFAYIYTGCYKVEIKNEDGYILKTLVKYLATNYTKKYISISAIGSYSAKSYSFILTIDNKFINEEFELDFKLIKLNNSKRGIIISTWCIKCSWNSENNEQFANVTCNRCIHSENNEQFANVTCNSYISNKPAIKCMLENLDVGYYKMEAELLNDIRCEGQAGSAWNNKNHSIHSNPCLYKFNITATQDIIEPEPIEPKSYTLWIIVIIALILIITCVICIIYVRKRSAFASEDVMQYIPVQQQINESFDIFLVYARDCDVVMETMTALKQVLEECTTSCVHDIYDPSTLQELASSPHDWVLSKLSRPARRMKTLLLASHCGHIQLQHPSVLYREPRFYDNLFRLAVRVIADNTQCSSNEALFVLNFSADAANDYESFVSFTPGRRFPLPENLHALLRQLGCDVQDTESVDRFREKCSEMETYFLEKQNYIGNVLDVQVENI